MSVDVKEPLDAIGSMNAIEAVEGLLDESPLAQDESSTSFAEAFDQIQALSLDLFARHKCMEVSTQQKSESDKAFGGLVEELQKLCGQLQSDRQLTEQGWTDIRAGHQQFVDDHAGLREIRDSFLQTTADFAGVKAEVERQREDVQMLCKDVQSHLSTLATATAALSTALAQPKSDSQITDVIEYAKQQQTEWLEQRGALEAELDATRRRAAEQAEALSAQKRLAKEQQTEFAGEVKRLQSLLEAMSGQVRANPSAAGVSAKQQEDEGSVMGSVLAQFETLQRDIKSRQAKRSNEPNAGGKASPAS
jgi:hypothetical protein